MRTLKQINSLAVTTVLVWMLPVLTHAQGIQYRLESVIGPRSIEDLIVALLNVFIIIAVPIIILFIIYAGFLYVTAQGNAQQVQTATRALTYAIIGGILVLGAVTIAEIIRNTINSFT